MSHGCVLDDGLLKEFWAFQRGHSYNADVVEKILRLYHPPYLTCNRQLVSCGIDDDSLMQGLMADGWVNQTLEELSQKTLYKVVLTDQASDPSKGYFSIADGGSNKLGKYYSLTAKKGEPRTHLHDYLRKLLSDAKTVEVCDYYFDSKFSLTKELFCHFPSTKVNVFFSKQETTKAASLNPANLSQLKTNYSNIAFPRNTKQTYQGLHDRYLLINNKIEVIITSGIDHLFDPHLTKECTIIVRQV